MGYRAKPTLDLVANDRLADLVGNGKTHPHRLSGCVNQNEIGRRDALAVAVNVSKRAVLIQPVDFCEQLLSERLRRKVLSALVATAGKRASAALRLHSVAEAVHFALSALFGLVSSFHISSPIGGIRGVYRKREFHR